MKDHYTRKAERLCKYKDKYNVSEREIAYAFDLSKSDTHRMISIGRLETEIRDLARKHYIDKYSLYIYSRIDDKKTKKKILTKWKKGELRKRSELIAFIG